MKKFINPFYFVIFLSSLLFYLLKLDYKNYKYIDLHGFPYYIIILNIMFIILGLAIPLMKYNTLNIKKYNYNLKYNKYFMKILKVMLAIGVFCTIIKIIIVFKNIGLPTNPLFFVQSRMAFFRGEFHFPFIIQVGAFLLFPSLVCFLLLYKFKKYNKKYILALIVIMIILNDVIIGGRGVIAFVFIYILFFNLFFDKFLHKDITYIKNIIIGLTIVISFFIYINTIREGSNFYNALEQLISYMIGPFFATFIDLTKLFNDPVHTYGFYTFGGILRYLINLNLDFGYVPIYKNYNMGFNSFLYISYIVRDFGFAGSLLFSFIIGIIAQYLYISLKRNFELIKFLIFINIMILLFFFFRDIASKWTSWWTILFTIFIMIIGGVKIEKNTNS